MHSGWTLVEPTGERIEMSFATRAYTLVELERMLTAVGFDVERACGDYQGSEYASRQPAHDRDRPPSRPVNFFAVPPD